MAVNDSREVVIEATPEEILDVIADVETMPTNAAGKALTPAQTGTVYVDVNCPDDES